MKRSELLRKIEEQIGCALIRAGLPLEDAENEVEEFGQRLRQTETDVLREIFERGCVREAEIISRGGGVAV